MQSSLKVLIIFFVFTSCARLHESKAEYSYPVSNPYPNIFETVHHEDFGDLLKVKLKTSSLTFECTERNDQPYYWCGIDGELTSSVKGFPSNIETIFHVQIPKWGVRNTEKILKEIRVRSSELTVIIHRDPKIDKKRNSFWGKLFLFYDSHSCISFLGTENFCPARSKVENIYLK